MAINPIAFTGRVVRSFLRYQLTAYPFAGTRLLSQMRRLLSLDETRQSPLLKGPYVSLARPFRQGAGARGIDRRKALGDTRSRAESKFPSHWVFCGERLLCQIRNQDSRKPAAGPA